MRAAHDRGHHVVDDVSLQVDRHDRQHDFIVEATQRQGARPPLAGRGRRGREQELTGSRPPSMMPNTMS